MTRQKNKSLARSLGEFVGHVWRGVRTSPTKSGGEKREVKRTVEEEDRGDVILRRTTIEEIEIRDERERK